MKFLNYTFTFSPFITLSSVCLALLMLAASYWQNQRYHYKVQLKEKLSAHDTSAAMQLSAKELQARGSSLLFEKVQIEGHFDCSKELAIINRSNGKESGFWLMSPFLLSGSQDALLVSRGFIPFSDHNPDSWSKYCFNELQQKQSIQVVLQDGTPGRNWFAPMNPPSENKKEFKQKWTYADIAAISKQYSYPLVQGVFAQQLAPAQNGGRYPEENIHIGLPPSTHFWYSIEWILLALVSIGTGLALQLFSRKPRPAQGVLAETEQNSRNVLHVLVLFALSFATSPLALQVASATSNPSEVREKARVEEHLGDTVDLSLEFSNAEGSPVTLKQLAPDNRPIILAPVYYECPELCGLTQSGLAKAVNKLGVTLGKDFRLVSLSFDPSESPAYAKKKAALYRERLSNIPEEYRESWHFLVGEEAAIKKITSQIGFFYEKDADDFMHAAVLAVLTPEGVISRYLYGIRFDEKDLKLAIIEASEGKVGSTLERALMFCFRYDHIQGKYTVSIMRITRVVCIAFFLLLAACLLWLRVKENRRPSTQ